MKPTVKATLGALFTVATFAIATPAMAVNWKSANDPAYAFEDGVAQAAAYGQFTNYQNSEVRSRSWQKDMRAGGQSVYVDTKFYFYYEYCSPSTGQCSTGFHYEGHEETDRTTSGSWSDQSVWMNLHSQGTQARGNMHVCEDHAFSGDPCSPWYIATFSY